MSCIIKAVHPNWNIHICGAKPSQCRQVIPDAKRVLVLFQEISTQAVDWNCSPHQNWFFVSNQWVDWGLGVIFSSTQLCWSFTGGKQHTHWTFTAAVNSNMSMWDIKCLCVWYYKCAKQIYANQQYHLCTRSHKVSASWNTACVCKFAWDQWKCNGEQPSSTLIWGFCCSTSSGHWKFLVLIIHPWCLGRFKHRRSCLACFQT